MEIQKSFRGLYALTKYKDSFYLAQVMSRQLRKDGYYVPVLALERELKKARAHQFLTRRRKTQLTYRYEERFRKAH